MSETAPLDFIALDLPIPPSLNNLFPTNKRGHRFIDPKYALWREHAGFEINTKRPGTINGPVWVDIKIHTITRSDIDNRVKGILDLLVKYAVIDGDSSKTLRGFTAQWDDETPRMRVEIRRCA